MTEQRRFQLRITGPEFEQTFVLPIGTTTVGRQVGNDVVLKHPRVSRRHALIECTADRCQIVDLGSANGTAVNGESLTADVPLALKQGDLIEIGAFRLTLQQTALKPIPATPPVSPPAYRAEPSSASTPVRGADPSAAQGAVDFATPPPGLSSTESRYLEHLPGIYHTEFMARFLAMFEAITIPIEWNIDNFDLYLDPGTAPAGFLPWLSSWFDLTFDSSWREEQRRTMLAEAHKLFERRGTKWALGRVLQIYTGFEPQIEDIADDLEPFTFVVRIPAPERTVDRTLVQQLIDAHKPAHTNYKLQFKK